MSTRPNILTLAGFDPSAGAGVLADIKTIEQIGGYGLAAQTANTVQDDRSFKACYWLPLAQIEAQLHLMFSRFKIEVVKVGIVENITILNRLLDLMLSYNQELKVVIDPVLSSSTTFNFHEDVSQWADASFLRKIFLITPNAEEALRLVPGSEKVDDCQQLSMYTNVLLKGGHRRDQPGVDVLWLRNGDQLTFPADRFSVAGKHGSGCVLSSAIATYLALGDDLRQACRAGKRYTERFLHSNDGLLGYHSP